MLIIFKQLLLGSWYPFAYRVEDDSGAVAVRCTGIRIVIDDLSLRCTDRRTAAVQTRVIDCRVRRENGIADECVVRNNEHDTGCEYDEHHADDEED